MNLSPLTPAPPQLTESRRQEGRSSKSDHPSPPHPLHEVENGGLKTLGGVTTQDSGLPLFSVPNAPVKTRHQFSHSSYFGVLCWKILFHDISFNYTVSYCTTLVHPYPNSFPPLQASTSYSGDATSAASVHAWRGRTFAGAPVAPETSVPASTLL